MNDRPIEASAGSRRDLMRELGVLTPDRVKTVAQETLKTVTNPRFWWEIAKNYPKKFIENFDYRDPWKAVGAASGLALNVAVGGPVTSGLQVASVAFGLGREIHVAKAVANLGPQASEQEIKQTVERIRKNVWGEGKKWEKLVAGFSGISGLSLVDRITGGTVSHATGSIVQQAAIGVHESPAGSTIQATLDVDATKTHAATLAHSTPEPGALTTNQDISAGNTSGTMKLMSATERVSAEPTLPATSDSVPTFQNGESIQTELSTDLPDSHGTPTPDEAPIPSGEETEEVLSEDVLDEAFKQYPTPPPRVGEVAEELPDTNLNIYTTLDQSASLQDASLLGTEAVMSPPVDAYQEAMAAVTGKHMDIVDSAIRSVGVDPSSVPDLRAELQHKLEASINNAFGGQEGELVDGVSIEEGTKAANDFAQNPGFRNEFAQLAKELVDRQDGRIGEALHKTVFDETGSIREGVGKLVEVKKGDTFDRLFALQNQPLHYTAGEADRFAAAIALNHTQLEAGWEKLAPNLSSQYEIALCELPELAEKAKNGDKIALERLVRGMSLILPGQRMIIPDATAVGNIMTTLAKK